MEPQLSDRWVLAFDASCCQCRRIAERVRQSGGEKLDVLSLADPKVSAWRVQALGADAPPAPTLLRVRDGRARAWVGGAMAVPLARRLGARATLRLLGALGKLSRGSTAADQAAAATGLPREQFLRLAGVGAAAALLTGRIPVAAAASHEPSAAEKWVRDNRDRLPKTYAGVVTHDLAHRRAIFAELSAGERADLWREHLRDYLAAHPGLSASQRQVVDSALALSSRESMFAAPMTPDSPLHRRQDELRKAAIRAFGKDEARALLATLGPAAPSAAAGDCACNCWSDYCGGSCVCCGDCDQCWCACSDSGCGTFWTWRCEGTCT